MTNNPTIDGVSLELRLLLNSSVNGTEQEQGRARNELRALLNAPAVERQEADSNSWRLNPEIRCAQCVGHGTYLDGEQCGTCSGSGLKSGATLQSTIARLEARITQLESEKELMLRGAEVYKERIAELESGDNHV